MSFNIEAACGSFVGNGRKDNQDNFYFNGKRLPLNNKGLKTPIRYSDNTDNTVLFALFDGMGGESYGEIAAGIASETFSNEIKKLNEIVVSGKEFFYKACRKADAYVSEAAKEKQVNCMGTTMAGLFFWQNEIYNCNVGDSKIFRIRDRKMVQVSEDHTDEKILNSMGLAKKPVLLQYIGISDSDLDIEPYIAKGNLQDGDIYVMCSDGVSDYINVAELYDFIRKYKKTDDAVREILAECDKRNAIDNATMIIAKITERKD